MCVNAFGGFLGDRPSVTRFVDHIEHAMALAGPDAVGIGADFIDDLLPILDPILEGALVDRCWSSQACDPRATTRPSGKRSPLG